MSSEAILPDSEPNECAECEGTGELVEITEPRDWWYGSGVNVREHISRCPDCGGSGYERRER